MANNENEEQTVNITPGGTVRVAEDATIYEMRNDGTVHLWMLPRTPEVASPSTSQGRKRRHSPKRCRRSLQLRDDEIYVLNDSGSSSDDEDKDKRSDDEVDDGIEDLSLLRFAAAQARAAELEVEERDMEMDSGTFLWSDDPTSFTGQKESYNRDPGPTFYCTDPVNVFLKYWDREFMAQVVTETNRYAWQFISQLSDPDFGTGIPSYLDSWTEVTVDEMYRYFALIILMSFCHRSKINEYWDTGYLGMSTFRLFMSRNRFVQINKFMHFVDNDNLTTWGYDRKVEKIVPLLQHCNKKFSELYTPSQFLSLDESFLLWKGRQSWKQCIRSRAARFGIKSFELCEAKTGYLLQYRLYTGRRSDKHSDSLHGFQDHTAKVVLDLMEGYLDVGHVLVMDNWYNQMPLTRYLKSRHTDVFGTINRRRLGVPQAIKDLRPKRMERGTTVIRHSGDIVLVAWKDNKIVTVMSTYHQHEMVLRKRAGIEREIPVAVGDYYKYMRGVDIKDQKLSSFLIERKGYNKWYMKVFRRLLNISLLNAYILYTKNPIGRVLSHRSFRRKVAEDLLSLFPRASPAPVSNIMHERRLLPGKHYPIHTEASASGSRKKQMECVRCLALKKRRSVTTMCQLCMAPLCLGQCWAEYHDK